MTTRTYYLPKNRLSIYLLNLIVSRVGCSIGNIEPMRTTETLKVPITCNDKDITKIERILFCYGMMNE